MLNNYSEQYKYRKKYQRIKCPLCGHTSRVVTQQIVQRIPGLQTRECTNPTCKHIFFYDYVMESDYQDKFWKGVLPK